MGILDSLKNSVEQAKSAINGLKTAKEAEKLAREEEIRIATEKAEQERKAKEEKIHSGKQDKSTGIFMINTMEDTIAFTREYMKKLVLPASSLKTSKLKMMPYTDDNVTRRDVKKVFSDISEDEKIFFLIENSAKKEYLTVTTSYLYAKIASDFNPDFCYTIKITLSDISTFQFESSENNNNIFCNEELIMSFPNKSTETDFINLKYYFKCLEKSDFEITAEEIDHFIHEKIGDEAYGEAKKYMDDDELILYFAWGVNSMSAKDFLMCTTKQFVLLDRELLGVAQNVKRFYHEDIISMSVDQTNSSSLTVTLLNAAMKICDLTIFTAGTNLKIQTLSVTEAERVVELYNHYKKIAKEESKKPIVVQQAETTIDPLEQLEKLKKLRDAEIITEEEFLQKKSALLEKI